MTTTNRWEYLEQQLPVIIGVSEVLGGFSLITIASQLPFLTPSVPHWLSGILSNLGIGLVAAGIVTGTIETISRKRLQSDIAEIKEAHFESILKGFMPTSIFEEIKTHIIGEPFLRRKFRWTFEFSWKDEKKEWLNKDLVAYYEVENISRTLENYELLVMEERTREDLFPDIKYIRKIEVYRNGQEEPDEYSYDNLKEKIENIEQYIKVSIPVSLKPNERVKIRVSLENILPSRDIHYCGSARMAENFEIIAIHPVDLDLQATAMHPSRNKFKTHAKTRRLKHWQIEAGVLPYQGVEISWNPLEAEALLKKAELLLKEKETFKETTEYTGAQRIVEEVKRVENTKTRERYIDKNPKDATEKLEKAIKTLKSLG